MSLHINIFSWTGKPSVLEDFYFASFTIKVLVFSGYFIRSPHMRGRSIVICPTLLIVLNIRMMMINLLFIIIPLIFYLIHNLQVYSIVFVPIKHIH